MEPIKNRERVQDWPWIAVTVTDTPGPVLEAQNDHPDMKLDPGCVVAGVSSLLGDDKKMTLADAKDLRPKIFVRSLYAALFAGRTVALELIDRQGI